MKPRLLDLFCGAGGAARGYADAGFDVVGVDIAPQPNYPFEFHLDDAFNWLATGDGPFDAVHASPPCQGYSLANNAHGRPHPLLIDRTRKLLEASGLPYVIENVEGARRFMHQPVAICGLSVGMNVRRHRLFETNWPLLVPPCGDHSGDWLQVFGTGAPRRRAKGFRPSAPRAEAHDAMGIDWMSPAELSEAIPPAYCELIGHQLMTYLRSGEVAA